jgi:hypothetical protein
MVALRQPVKPSGSYLASSASALAVLINHTPACVERSKLAGLSGEGRSSATTLLISTALEWMNSHNSGVPKEKRKLLGFTDNRQDAALQAGHFNDFLSLAPARRDLARRFGRR